MFQKFCHWVTRSSARRPLWVSAAVMALLVHLVLLGLFRYTPQVRSKDAGSLAMISSVDFGKPENQELVQYVSSHDPSLMTAPDTPCGYARAVLDTPFRPAAEDLPRPPQLARPRPGAAPEVERRSWRNPEVFPVTAAVRPAVLARPVRVSGVQVFCNGNAEPVLTGKLNEKFLRLKRSGVPVEATEIAALPQTGRFRLVQSSGDAELDRMALYELVLYSRTAKTGSDDIYSVDWRNALTGSEAKP